MTVGLASQNLPVHGARVGEPNLLLRASALRGRRRTSVAQSCHAWCHDCHSRSSGDRCAPPSLALRAGRNPLVALRATRPNWDGAADMASEPRACVALLRVRSSAHPGPPPRLQAGGPPPLLALRAGCRLLIVALRDSTDSRTPRSRACARLSGQCAYTSRSTASSHGRRMPRCAHGCAPTREVSDSATRRASCVASARICYVLRSARTSWRTSCAAPSCTRRHARNFVGSIALRALAAWRGDPERKIRPPPRGGPPSSMLGSGRGEAGGVARGA